MDNYEKTLAARKRAADWQKANPERYKERQKRWREANREKCRIYQEEYRRIHGEDIKRQREDRLVETPNLHKRRHLERVARDPDYRTKVAERTRKWYARDKVRAKELIKAWKANNPERYRTIRAAACVNRRTRMSNIGKMSAAIVREIRSHKVCAVCGRCDGQMEIDHIVALSCGGTNERSNLQLLCRPCNRQKWATDFATWLVRKAADSHATV